MSDGRNAQGYFSQNDEEKYILEWTPEKGRLLDIGAWWPTNLSNSRALIQRGWEAVLVEPSPGPMRVLLEEYGGNERVTLIQAAVTAKNQPTVVMDFTDYPVSTSDHAVKSLWETDPNTRYLGKLSVWGYHVQCLIANNGPFDLISIDAEGQSFDIAMSILETLSDELPQCLCVEHDGKAELLQLAAQTRGYTKFHLTPENLIAAR